MSILETHPFKLKSKRNSCLAYGDRALGKTFFSDLSLKAVEKELS